MATFTNSEGKLLTYTNEFLETVLLQLNSSNNYYTSGEHDTTCIRTGCRNIDFRLHLSHQPKHFSKLYNK